MGNSRSACNRCEGCAAGIEAARDSRSSWLRRSLTKARVAIEVRTANMEPFTLYVSPEESILALKLRIQRAAGVDVGMARLIHGNQELPDKVTVRRAGLRRGGVLQLMVLPPGSTPNAVDENLLKEADELIHATEALASNPLVGRLDSWSSAASPNSGKSRTIPTEGSSFGLRDVRGSFAEVPDCSPRSPQPA